MKRRLILAALVTAAISCASVGTLAYFTTSESVDNVITAGNIRIALHELDADGEPFESDEIGNVMPSQEVVKKVYVENTGDNTAWIRLKPEKVLKDADGYEAEAEDADSLILLNIDEENWTKEGDWYYYNQPLEGGENTEPLFTSVTVSEEMGNEYKNGKIHVRIKAQAVQHANNGEAVMKAAGWPEEKEIE